MHFDNNYEPNDNQYNMGEHSNFNLHIDTVILTYNVIKQAIKQIDRILTIMI